MRQSVIINTLLSTVNAFDVVIIVLAVCAVVGYVGYAVWKKKQGKGGCGCGCAHCPSAGACPSSKKAAEKTSSDRERQE